MEGTQKKLQGRRQHKHSSLLTSSRNSRKRQRSGTKQSNSSGSSLVICMTKTCIFATAWRFNGVQLTDHHPDDIRDPRLGPRHGKKETIQHYFDRAKRIARDTTHFPAIFVDRIGCNSTAVSRALTSSSLTLGIFILSNSQRINQLATQPKKGRVVWLAFWC